MVAAVGGTFPRLAPTGPTAKLTPTRPSSRRSSAGVCPAKRTCCIWVQPTVTFPFGDHVNVLHDYKKTGPSTILKLLTCRCRHLIDILVEFSQNNIFLTLLKCLNLPYPLIFTNFCINYYAHVPCGGTKIAKNPSAY